MLFVVFIFILSPFLNSIVVVIVVDVVVVHAFYQNTLCTLIQNLWVAIGSLLTDCSLLAHEPRFGP